MNIDFEDIRDNLSAIRSGFLASSLEDFQSGPRNVREAEEVLNTLKLIYEKENIFLQTYPGFSTILENKLGPHARIWSRENIIETCFYDEFLFPELGEYPFFVDEDFNSELLKAQIESFEIYIDELTKKHIECQKELEENFNPKNQTGNLVCHCHDCLAKFRAKLRDYCYNYQIALIDEHQEKLQEQILETGINRISDSFAGLKKKLEKSQKDVRNKLKRSTLSKLNSQINAYIKSTFSIRSDIGKVYRERLKVFFNTILVERGFEPDLIKEEEYERFFIQLETNLWKHESFLRREFNTFVEAILTFKTKDISSTILKDYLGQFWLHSDARRMNRKFIYHMGPTNSGKTYHSIQALCKAKTGTYLAPLRLLAGELYDTMSECGVKTTLLTGEEVLEHPDATHYSSTIEMAKLDQDFDCSVIDEIQMITDPQRGWAWTRALVSLKSKEVHLCGDPSVLNLIERILELTGDTLEIKEYQRMTELQVLDQPITLANLRKNDALIVFSRRNALKYKADLEEMGLKVSIVYGRLSPEVRREQARKFDAGETDVMVSTDAIAMGMNLPVKRIVFSAVSKFFDSKEHPLSPSEIKQIAGRAGRFKRFDIGEVTCLSTVDNGLMTIKNALTQTLKQKKTAMVGPDLEIFTSVNEALATNSLPRLPLSSFLRLFNTISFENPFYCVDLKEMIELAEIVESSDENHELSLSEIFGFTCAPVNMGLIEHVQYYVWILNHYSKGNEVYNEPIDVTSNDIDYLETAIKCVELFQWLARHFSGKNFSFDEKDLLYNKGLAIEKLNTLLSDRIAKTCSSCGVKLPFQYNFNICDGCFKQRRFGRRSSHKKSHNEGEKNTEKSSSNTETGGGQKSYYRKKSSTGQAGGQSGGQRSSSDIYMNKSKSSNNSKKKTKKKTFKRP